MGKIMLGGALLFAAAVATQSVKAEQDGPRNAMSIGAMQDRTSKSPAEALFVEKCAMCHRQMGMGTVLLSRRLPANSTMLEQRTDLTPEYITSAARMGIGNMPRIPRGEVSDAQLDTIAAYLAKGKK